MRRIATVGVSFAATLIWLAGLTSAQLPKDFVFYANCDEGSGDAVKDYSPNALVLKVAAGKPKWTDGKFGKALELDGATAYQAKKAGTVAKLKDTISVGAWVKPVALSGWSNLIEMDAPAGTRANKAWKTGFNNAQLVFTTYEVKDHNGSASLKVGEWTHVAYTYDTKSAKLYINGKLDKDEPGSGTFDTSSDVVTTIDIGWRSTTSSSFFNGLVDELWVSNVVKSEKEISDLMGGIALPVEPIGKSAVSWGALKTAF
jgi:hypothetical protein